MYQISILTFECSQSLCLYSNLILSCNIIDQLKNTYIEFHYNDLSYQTVFEIWAQFFVFENVGKNNAKFKQKTRFICNFSVTRLAFNTIIYIRAKRNFPEFNGYRSNRFPGTRPPHLPNISPRRLNLPLDFASDWKKIGYRRRKDNHSIVPVEI